MGSQTFCIRQACLPYVPAHRWYACQFEACSIASVCLHALLIDQIRTFVAHMLMFFDAALLLAAGRTLDMGSPRRPLIASSHDEPGVYAETNHAEWVTLESVGPRQVLVHHGVGERYHLPFLAQLVFRDGLGILVPTANENGLQPMWVNVVLLKSLHMQEVSPGRTGLAVFDKELNKSIWRDTLAGKHSVVAFESPCVPEFSCEVYFYHFSPCGGPGARAFFSIPYFQNYMFGPSKHNRWICKNLHRWSAWLEECGVVSGLQHFVFSSKAHEALAKQQAQQDQPFFVAAAAAQEYGASSLAVILLLAHWASSTRRVLPQQNKAAAALLQHLIVRVFQGLKFDVHFAVGQLRVALRFRDGSCCMTRQDVEERLPRRTQLAWDLLVEFEKEVLAHEFIMPVHRCSAKSWRCQRQDVKQCIKQALLSDDFQFHNLVEDMDAEEWRNADPLTLLVMRLASKRAQRVSTSRRW